MHKEYGKIDTLFERDDRFVVDPNKIKNPVYDIIKSWVVTEKVDGTNIRVTLTEDDRILFGGRSDNAQIPAFLLNELQEKFTPELLRQVRREDDDTTAYTFYGEGYGPRIQKGGGLYRDTPGFILFDVSVGDRTFLSDGSVSDIADRLHIDRVPIISQSMTLPEIVELVKEGFDSLIPGANCRSEGVVARPIVPLYDQRGKRVILKLKTKDFVSGKR